MDLLALKKDSAAIDEGRWIGADEVPGLGDVRVKMRGLTTQAARDMFSAKHRRVDPRDRLDGNIKADVAAQIMREVLSELLIVEIEGFTMGGKPIETAKVRDLVLEPDFDPLCDLLVQAAQAVDRTRAARQEEIAKNS